MNDLYNMPIGECHEIRTRLFHRYYDKIMSFINLYDNYYESRNMDRFTNRDEILLDYNILELDKYLSPTKPSKMYYLFSDLKDLYNKYTSEKRNTFLLANINSTLYQWYILYRDMIIRCINYPDNLDIDETFSLDYIQNRVELLSTKNINTLQFDITNLITSNYKTGIRGLIIFFGDSDKRSNHFPFYNFDDYLDNIPVDDENNYVTRSLKVVFDDLVNKLDKYKISDSKYLFNKKSYNEMTLILNSMMRSLTSIISISNSDIIRMYKTLYNRNMIRELNTHRLIEFNNQIPPNMLFFNNLYDDLCYFLSRRYLYNHIAMDDLIFDDDINLVYSLKQSLSDFSISNTQIILIDHTFFKLYTRLNRRLFDISDFIHVIIMSNIEYYGVDNLNWMLDLPPIIGEYLGIPVIMLNRQSYSYSQPNRVNIWFVENPSVYISDPIISGDNVSIKVDWDYKDSNVRLGKYLQLNLGEDDRIVLEDKLND